MLSAHFFKQKQHRSLHLPGAVFICQ